MRSLAILACILLPQFAVAANYYVIGDTGQCDVEGTARVSSAIQARGDVAESTLIEVGDLAYPVATLQRLQECHEPYWLGFKRRLAVPGNHDWKDNSGAGFFSLFPDPVPRKVPLEGSWYILLLNSNLQGQEAARQQSWLAETLQQGSNECLIAAWHHPRWSSGNHGDNPFTQPLWELIQGRVTFSLHGHDHHFEALPMMDTGGRPVPESGVASFIVGNSGAPLYKAGSKRHPGTAIFGEWGYMRVELNGDRYSWEALGANGVRFAQGSGTCRKRK